METIDAPRVEPVESRELRGETVCTAELAECTCPDFCERDHDND